jgi:hypothetical protein
LFWQRCCANSQKKKESSQSKFPPTVLEASLTIPVLKATQCKGTPLGSVRRKAPGVDTYPNAYVIILHYHKLKTKHTFYELQYSFWITFIIPAIDCKDPGTIDNGRIIIMNETTTYNSAVEYHCIPTFQRIGPYLRKCMEDGNWSGEEPRCESKIRTIFIRSLGCKYIMIHL